MIPYVLPTRLIRRNGEPVSSGGSRQRRNEGPAADGTAAPDNLEPPGALHLPQQDAATNGPDHLPRLGALHPPEPRMVPMDDQPCNGAQPPRSAMPPSEQEERHLELRYTQTDNVEQSWARAAWHIRRNEEEGLPTHGVDSTMYPRAPMTSESTPRTGGNIPFLGGGSRHREPIPSPSRSRFSPRHRNGGPARTGNSPRQPE